MRDNRSRGLFDLDARIESCGATRLRACNNDCPRRGIDPRQPAVKSIHEATHAPFAERHKARKIMRLRVGEPE